MDSVSTAAPNYSKLELVHALAALLPALVLAWPGPGALLAGDFLPQATGAGIALVCALPAAFLCILRGPSFRGLLLYGLPLLIATSWLAFGEPRDTFEARRMQIVWVTGLVLLLSGASLGARGRAWLARGSVVIAVVVLLHAHFDGANQLHGLLGNSGSTSEASLIGAIVGGVLLVRGAGPWRWIGAAALALELAYVARAPVLSGAIALGAAFAVLALRTSGGARVRALGLVALALAAMLVPLLARNISPTPIAGEPGASAPALEAAPQAGFPVRLLVWKASAVMFGARPWLGVGPGQFAVQFPLWRDAREIERSTHARRLPQETEVEHPHNDWILPTLEGGVVAGIAWLGFLALALVVAWRTLPRADVPTVALAAATIGILINAGARAPFFSNPLGGALACVALGCVLAREYEARRARMRRVVAAIVALLALTLAPSSLALAEHGLALQALAHNDLSPAQVERALERADRSGLDSVTVQTLRARWIEQQNPALAPPLWRAVLELRPHRVEAWMQLGAREAEAGNFDAAREAFDHVLRLDPGHPGARRNLATLEIGQGRLDVGLALLDGAPDLTPAWLTAFAARTALRGLEREAEALFARADPTLANPTPELAYQRFKDAPKDSELADAWEARAHRLWGREHAAAGRWAEAVRSIRQDLRVCGKLGEGRPMRPRLELTAALLMAARTAEAERELADLAPKPSDLAAIPTWARERLALAGVHASPGS